MEITKEKLEERLKGLEAQKNNLIASVNACEGGVLTVKGLLDELARDESKKVKKDKK